MKNQTLFALGISALLFTSCKKENQDPAEKHIVFVGGTAPSQTYTGKSTAVIWENGIVKEQGQSTNATFVFATTVQGKDVYSTGYENTANGWRCMVWKNGALDYSLGDGVCHGNAIAVSGNDVYVAGHAYDQGFTSVYHYAIVWKNQDAQFLTDGLRLAEAKAIAVKGEDVYVAGYYGQDARLWKNGQEQPLNGAAGYWASGLTIKGNDVYIVGHSYDLPLKTRVWKNGIPADIPAGTGDTMGKSIAVSDNGDIYIAGYEIINNEMKARLWKNGIAQTLNNDEIYGNAHSVSIKDNIVYVAGEVRNTLYGQSRAAIWKNGVQTILGGSGSSANCIYVQ